MNPSSPRPRGRPRSDTTRRAVLAATLRLLRTQTVQSLTIEAIARDAQVSKATIYRWWSSKSAIVIDAFLEHHVVHTPMNEEIGAVQALSEHLTLLGREYRGRPGQLVAQIIAESQGNPDVSAEFHERFIKGRSELVLRVIEAGKKRGELRKDVPSETIAECLYAPVYFRLLVTHQALDKAYIERHTKTVLDLFRLTTRTRTARANRA